MSESRSLFDHLTLNESLHSVKIHHIISDMMGDISRKLVPRDDHGIEVPKDACRLHGSIPVDKIKGNFHILSG